MVQQRPRKGKIVVFGILFWYPLAGVSYQFLHYLIGLRRLGYDPYYVEDSARWIYDPVLNDLSPDASRNVEAVAAILERYGFVDRWAFRGCYPGGRCFGMTESQILQLYHDADAFLNITGAQEIREEHMTCPRRIYVETDPVASQIRVAQGDASMIAMLAAHDCHFSFGENLGDPSCGVPVEQFRWKPTRQPVVLDLWAPSSAPDEGSYRTIATWQNKGKDIVWQGEKYFWSKSLEYEKFLSLPRRTRVPLEIAVRVDRDVRDMLCTHGWRIADPLAVSGSLDAYREYIQRSRAEFTVAKDQNIRLKSGWFSDRSACYLASGRPVITQDTGFSNVLPVGRGLFSFRSMEDILAAIDAIESDYDCHRNAAREIAAEYFSAEKVVGELMSKAGI